jgi:hypothetical protein
MKYPRAAIIRRVREMLDEMIASQEEQAADFADRRNPEALRKSYQRIASDHRMVAVTLRNLDLHLLCVLHNQRARRRTHSAQDPK